MLAQCLITLNFTDKDDAYVVMELDLNQSIEDQVLAKYPIPDYISDFSWYRLP